MREGRYAFGRTHMQGNVGLNKWGDGRGGLFTLHPCSLQHTLASTVLPRRGGKRYVLFSWFVLDHGQRFQIYSYEHTQRPCSAEGPRFCSLPPCTRLGLGTQRFPASCTLQYRPLIRRNIWPKDGAEPLPFRRRSRPSVKLRPPT